MTELEHLLKASLEMVTPKAVHERKLGATDISKLVGMNPYGGPASVYDRIINRVDAEWNDAMRRGIAAEPHIRALAVQSYGLELESHPGIIQSGTHDFATASPDDVGVHLGTRTLIEYKSVNEWGAGKWGADDWTDAVPEHYHLQVRWGMGVCELERALLIAAFGADDDAGGFTIKWARIYEFHRDREIERRLFAVGRHFWESHIVPRRPPPPDPKPTKRARKPKEKRHE